MEKLTHFKIGQIVNTQGLKGEVRVYPFTDDIYRFDDLEEFYLTQNTRGELEPLKAKRIMERIRFLVDEVVINGENRRNK